MAEDSKINGDGEDYAGNRSENITLEKTDTIILLGGRVKLRGKMDDLPQYALFNLFLMYPFLSLKFR